MSFDATINAYFVTTTNAQAIANDAGDKTSKDFQTSLTYLQNHIPEENIRQIKASEGFPLIASGRLTKNDVFIFDRFEGEFFQQLQQTKSLIIGPPCLIQCLLNAETVPLGTNPVYTCAMRDLQISATGITPQEKEKLKSLIQWMGGHYFQNFGRTVTHLISNTIKSTKYEHATLNGIPVMHVDWVQRVWERSCVAQVAATDAEFDKYKLPIFFGTNITCTGLDTERKNEVMRLVNENGGTYHRAFRSQLVDIVITEKNKTNSDKYAAAVRYKKDILTPEWIIDSVQKGFALPTKSYQVKSLKVSTPTKTDQSIADFTADGTHLSDISRISTVGRSSKSDMTTVNDTICSNMNESASSARFVAPVNPVSKDLKKDLLKKTGSGTHYRLVYEEICPKQAKKAGNFLDGCCIYLSGFRAEEKEKLNRILNVGGATRYDEVNEKVTHIIVGQLDDNEFKAWKKDNLLSATNIVRLDWLLESIKSKQTANEAIYRVSLPTSREPDAPSPSSKKTLRSMNHSFKQPEKPVKKKLFSKDPEKDEENFSDKNTNVAAKPTATSSNEFPLEADEEDLLSQYSQENVPRAEVPLPEKTINNEVSMAPHPIASSTQCKANEPAPTAGQPQSNPSDLTESTGITIDYENLDFFRGMSLYIDKEHFPEEFYTQMISECEAAQGNMVTAAFRDPVDYAIVSFESTLDVSKIPVKARHIITELYVESCMKVNKLVPIEYYHKHIPHTANSQPLDGMTIVISLYSLLERDFIDSLAQLLGANVNKTFVKKERPLLICPSPEGSKYEGALKWRYPVVTSEWLLECAKEGKKVNYSSYLVGDSPEDFPVSPTLRERNTSSITNAGSKSIQKTVAPTTPQHMDIDEMENNDADTLTSADMHPVATDTFTPLRNKRVSELAGPGRVTRQSSLSSSGADSPHTPTNDFAKASYNFDFMENILSEIENEEERDCLREVITEMRNNQTPELERIRRQACTPINRKIPTPKGIPDFCTTPEFEKRMADEFERRWRLPTKKMKPDTPIDEIRRRVMRATCKVMGIPYSDDDDERPSTSGGSSASSRRSLSLQKHKTTVDTTPLNNRTTRTTPVAPRSIFGQTTPNQSNTNSTFNTDTIEARKSDTFIPNTQSPGLSRSRHSETPSTSSGLGQRASLVGKSTINFDKISFEETEVGENVTNTNTNGNQQRPSLPLGASPEIKQITDYLRSCDSRRQSLKRTRQADDRGQLATETMETEAHYVQPFESEQLNTQDLVGWRDPDEFNAMRKASKPAAPLKQYPGTPRFSISCSDEETRDNVIGKILQLGGEVCENLINYDPECTHFVCEKPNRGEKMLGCLSSGKWVLSLKYIEESFAKDVFIDEELYEWGNCKALNLPQLSADEQIIAAAAHRWRRELSERNTGAFGGFKAILRIANRNVEALKNVIKAGDGEIIEAETPFRNCREAAEATHCFVDMKKCPITANDYEFLKNNDTFVLTQMYINAFLMNGVDVDMAKYQVRM